MNAGQDPSQPPHPPERQEEFVRLLSGAHHFLLRYICSLVGHRQEAEDVLQRASVVMWRRFETFEPGTDFIAWAATVAFYESRNFLRLKGQSRLSFDDELLRVLAAERLQVRRDPGPRLELLKGCVDRLDPAQRDLVASVYVEGQEIPAVAERLGRAPQTLYNHLSFIRRALADCVRRKMGEIAT